eukprot:TRINITY_DN4005_c0_g1_i2.p1 TRINITY_DN4005_c0_g1~~TRINITY_DN4005_c0_g1_i2.p1  ORF type:complete len:637 (+),score=196.82 TRINITY_DN4005_c0_g1_i2:35-1912(+)
MSRWVDLFANTLGMKALSLGARRVVLWGMGSTATAVSVAYDMDRGRTKGGYVIPVPAAEGFKDPFMDDDLYYESAIIENQSVEWLNQSIAPMWPYLDEGICKVVLERIQPAIQEAVPLIGKQLRFSTLSLGNETPQLGPVTSHLTEEGVELFVGVRYKGDLQLEFELGVATVNIADLTIAGEVMLTFKPLVNGINPIGGLEITCLNQPHLTLKLSAKGMFLDAVPNFYKLLKLAVDEAIADILVMPNNIAVNIPTVTGPRTDDATLKYRPPLGVLRVTVDSAQHLPGKTWTSNPYARLQIGAHHYYTDTVNKNLNPTWHGHNAEQDFMIFHPKQDLSVVMLKQNSMAADDVIGSCVIPVSELTKLKHKEVMALPLRDEAGVPMAATLKLRAEWLPLSSKPVEASTAHERNAAGRDAWRNGNASGIDNEQLTSLRVDRLFCAHPTVEGPYKVSLGVANKSVSSKKGRAGNLPMNLNTEALCELARRLCYAKLPDDKCAAVLDVGVKDYKSYKGHLLRRDKTPFPARNAEEEHDEDVKWAKDIMQKMKLRLANTEPVFQEILYLPSKLSPTFEVSVEAPQVVDGRQEYVSVAKGEYLLGSAGPYHLDGGYVVFGAPQVWYLGKAASA